MQLFLLLCLAVVAYTYVGYGIVITILVALRRWIKGRRPLPADDSYSPPVTLIIPAYNEMDCLPAKLSNSRALDYPAGQLRFLFVTEGSTDGSTAYLEALRDAGDPQISVLGGTERAGKVAAMNQAMQHVSTPLVVFSDANTQLNARAIRNLVRHFYDENVGAVAGEKRIEVFDAEAAAGAGEGLYWKYESYLKRKDAELHTVVGAAGELFALRTRLYEPVETDTLLDDFMISLRIAGRGYRVEYEPDAYALERPSFSIVEEKKRKVRIAAGGFQSIRRLLYLLNGFRYGWLTFQYVSHRVLRWAVTPFLLPLIWLANLALVLGIEPLSPLAYGFWVLLFIGQCAFYGAAWLGYRLEHRQLRVKVLFVPFYFTFMNGCAILGFQRYWRGNTSGIWEKARRANDLQLAK
ncbi:glycosyltransferase family 2 protein [Spirosoma sordidisoli]|uniref:Glycosyltransferase family 2 protein n=1 Tax=Spirosoma sordidisoli TaxID=2502893 RepID=A0A4Q2UQS8_9BACT|nr:glycosyltransferase family 2 protein [Spirosoma sordidisoli]RYC72123.1 glycosyltransferase family 2 protein [Spirosoma sordidisoli]